MREPGTHTLNRNDEAITHLRAALGSAPDDELARMGTELEALGDAKGVAALADRRESTGRKIAVIEGNLSEVRAALCR